MIAWLRGAVRFIEEDHAVLDVGGVGYRLFMSQIDLGTLARLGDGPDGETTSVYVHTAVREDAIWLYGFTSSEGRALFRTLIGVSGVGPKAAMALLSALSPAELADAISRGDWKRLTAANGVGKKLAERLALELKDKVAPPASLPEPAAARTARAKPEGEALWDDLRSALVNLGYKPAQAERAVETVRAEAASGTAPTLDLALRAALLHVGTRAGGPS